MAKFLNERMRVLRLAREMTQDELADRVGMSKSVISKYESGDRTPDLDTIGKLAVTLQVADFDLLYNERSRFMSDELFDDILSGK